MVANTVINADSEITKGRWLMKRTSIISITLLIFISLTPVAHAQDLSAFPGLLHFEASLMRSNYNSFSDREVPRLLPATPTTMEAYQAVIEAVDYLQTITFRRRGPIPVPTSHYEYTAIIPADYHPGQLYTGSIPWHRSVVQDGWTYPGAREGDPLLGPTPSRVKLIGFGLVGLGIVVAAEKYLHEPWKTRVIDSLSFSETWNVQNNSVFMSGQIRTRDNDSMSVWFHYGVIPVVYVRRF